MTKYKMMANWKEYDGVWTVDECGENVKVALNSMSELYNPSFTFTKVNDDGSPYTVKSAKKSESQPTSFTDMVKKQRNKSLTKMDEVSLITFFEGIYSEIGEIADRIKEVNNSDSRDSGIYYKIENIRTTLIHSIQAQIEEVLERIK